MLAFFIAFLQRVTARLQGPQKIIVPDSFKVDSMPEPGIKVVQPVIDLPKASAARWYLSPQMQVLLALIRSHEGGKAGYNADYANDDKWTLTNRTFDEVVGLSRRQVLIEHEPSSAIGGYQFLSKTLTSLKSSLSLIGDERFDAPFQDDLAVALMIRRGLMKYLRGEIGSNQFCNQLAMEWASLPVVTPVTRGKRHVKPGQSYYAGDGLNKSFHSVESIKNAVAAMRLSLANKMPKE